MNFTSMTRIGMLASAMALVIGQDAVFGQAAGAVDAAPAGSLASIQPALEAAANRPPNPRLVTTTTRGQLSSSISRADQFLAASGAEIHRGWSEWLRLGLLKEEVAKAQPDREVLRDISRGWDAGYAGLEMSPLLGLRRSLASFLAALDYAAAPAPQAEYQLRLEELAECLARLDSEQGPGDAHRAGAIVAWLEALSPEGAAIARSVRSGYCRQNAMAQVSGRFVNSLLEQKVEERQFLTDIILGTYTHGPAFTTGQVSFGIVPDPSRASLEVRLQGLTNCPSNVAQRRQVKIYSSATTTIAANKRVQLSDQGLTLFPAAAWCSTSARITGVTAGSRFVERIAMRRAGKMLPDAEAEGARKAEAHSSAKLDERADAALGGINDMYRGQIIAPLLRQDACPLLKFWTDAQHLRLAVSQHNGQQLAPASSPPQIPASRDLAIAAHESMIENFCQSMLGGVTARDQAFLDMLNLLAGSPPRALWVHDRAVRWSVTFDDERPIGARFRDGRLALTLRLASAQRGEEELKVPVEIEARLIPLREREGPAVARDGDIEIRFLESLPEEEEAAWRTFFARKFQAVFPPELHFDGLVPPAGGTLGRLRKLSLVEFDSQEGWTTLGYELPK